MSERERPTRDPDAQPKPKEPFEQTDASPDPDQLKKGRRQRGGRADQGPNNPT